MITDEQFDALLSQSDTLAKGDPVRYLRKMRYLLLVGDLYLAAITLSLLGLQGGAVFLLIRELWHGAPGWHTALCLPVLIWAIWLTRKLMLLQGGRKPTPGIPVTRQQAPELFTLIDTLCAQTEAPPILRVLITDIFNASIEQLPRLGLFGRHGRTLLLGLPLLKCVTVEQFRAVLAHELGHLDRKDPVRASQRVHFQMLRWTGLAQTVGNDPHGYLFKHFLEWFIDYCTAWAMPLARISEYEADALSVRLVSEQTVVETLCTNSITDRYLEDYYWPQVRRLAKELPEPIAPYRMLGEAFAAGVNVAAAESWLELDILIKTALDHTHPCLKERLAVLQAAPRIRLPEPGQTAEHLLGSALQPVTEQMDKEWQDKIRSWWVKQYEGTQETLRLFADLNARAANGEELSVEEAYQRAQLAWIAGCNEDETMRQLLALYSRAREHPLSSFGLGVWLLKGYDTDGRYTPEDGEYLLEQAMQLDEQYTAVCCEMLRDHCRDGDRDQEAEHWHALLTERLELEKAEQQAGGYSGTDRRGDLQKKSVLLAQSTLTPPVLQ